ncbi:MAG TPA: class I SAM-dependent methyltransferase [Bacteroidia bacterium]|uniref:class I SAM-dependent methyltransferase n=1 Tax=Ornithinibacillus gellani TaxID=2293253 RepID=UPI000F4772CE|nr:class I SAM-dependent methyltransferase [Ornithinibacillus gellani]TQS74715.1 class I SAM-dependent methyltransferase [Ornithinibacillus gellani]HET7819815.1 class I SAM-dependent methyltransferase [Bacteroidia bacterium]
MNRQSLIKKFDKQAKKYIKRRQNNHAYKFRQRIFREAEGKVLEVSIGTGLNFPFYNKNIELTGIDFSHEMLKAAQNAARNYPFKTTFMHDDVESVEFSANSFDTIVSSGSLCAYQNPIHVLNNFQKWCKPEGKILLLEHGLSTNKMVGWIQKSFNPIMLKFAGCHQDRNITDIVKKSNLKIIQEERHFGGYLYLIWAKP